MALLPERFTGTDDTPVTTYSSDWAYAASSDVGFEAKIKNNKIVTNRTSGTRCYLYWTESPPSTDYSVYADVYVSVDSSSDGFSGVIGRAEHTNAARNNYSWAISRVGASNHDVVMYKQVNSSATLLGSFSLGNVVGQTFSIRLSMIGTTITGYVDDVVRVQVTDSAHTAAGKAGIYFNNTHSGEGVTFIDNFDIISGAYMNQTLEDASITAAAGQVLPELDVEFNSTTATVVSASTATVATLAAASPTLASAILVSATAASSMATLTKALDGALIVSSAFTGGETGVTATLGNVVLSGSTTSVNTADANNTLTNVSILSQAGAEAILEASLSKLLGNVSLSAIAEIESRTATATISLSNTSFVAEVFNGVQGQSSLVVGNATSSGGAIVQTETDTVATLGNASVIAVIGVGSSIGDLGRTLGNTTSQSNVSVLVFSDGGGSVGSVGVTSTAGAIGGSTASPTLGSVSVLSSGNPSTKASVSVPLESSYISDAHAFVDVFYSLSKTLGAATSQSTVKVDSTIGGGGGVLPNVSVVAYIFDPTTAVATGHHQLGNATVLSLIGQPRNAKPTNNRIHNISGGVAHGVYVNVA